MRLSAIFGAALFLCTVIVFYFVYMIQQQVVLSPLTQILLYLFLWLLVVTVYAFHLVSLSAREQQLLRQHGEQMRRMMFQTVESMAYLIEMRDPYTAGHQRRVAKLAKAIAEEMNLPQDRVEGLVLAASVHDVGKIMIPADVLAKPRPLNREEIAMVRTHPQVGAEILKPVEFPMPVAEIVRQHHERLDGSGYGAGLTGKDILLEAKILAVADAVEAMANDRPYRPALGVDKALKEISGQNGAVYDKAVGEVCASLFKNKGFSFAESSASG